MFINKFSFRIVTIIFAILVMISCASKKVNTIHSQSISPTKPYVIKFDRGVCFGHCPVFTFYLLSDHTAVVHSKMNLTNTSGWFTAELDEESIVEILELIEPQGWWYPDFRDVPELPDLPPYELTYIHPDGLRNIKIHGRTTDSLEVVLGKINQLVTEADWIATNIRPVELTEADRKDIIVQLKGGVDIQSWMKKFSGSGIYLKKRLTPNQQYYLVSFNQSLVKGDEILTAIQQDADVIAAQWDKQLQERD